MSDVTKSIELHLCPNCGCEATVSIQSGEGWKKNVVGCGGVTHEETGEYLLEPCGLNFIRYNDEIAVEELIQQWNNLPRTESYEH